MDPLALHLRLRSGRCGGAGDQVTIVDGLACRSAAFRERFNGKRERGEGMIRRFGGDAARRPHVALPDPASTMSLGQTIRQGVKWTFLGNTGSHALQFLFGVALARLLVPADFGALVTVGAFTGFVGMLAAGGLGQSLIRSKQVGNDEFNAVFTLQLLMGVLIYTAFYLLAPLVGSYFDNPLYTDLLRVTAISFVIRPFASIRFAWLNRGMLFSKRAVIELSVGLLTGVASVAMAWAGMGVWSLVFAGLVGAFATNVLLSFIVPLKLQLRWHLETVRRHSRFGVQITLAELVNYIKVQAVYLMLSKSSGPVELGLLTRAESLARLPNRSITPATGPVVFRAMSKVQEDLDQTKYLFYRTITLLSVYISPLLVGLLWVAEPLVHFLYGPKWMQAVVPVQIMAIAGFFLPIGRPASLVIQAQNRIDRELVAQVGALVFGVVTAFVGLQWGLEGVAWTIVATHILSVGWLYLVAQQLLRSRLRDLFGALRPAVLLNGSLAIALALAHMALAQFKAEAGWLPSAAWSTRRCS
jgi:O-antigen/teichoic acid export membrane protein